MAQNYEIDIKRFNGQDYDTLLPTPASHASTHQANGSDPLTLQTGNYGSLSIPTSAYQNNSVTRAKLAQDALYSPVIGANATDTINSSHVGKTLRTVNGTTDYVFNVKKDSAIPTGAEIAILRGYAKTCNIVFEADAKVGFAGNSYWLTAPTFSIDEVFTMIALKKIASDADYDYWLVTGNVEVVS